MNSFKNLKVSMKLITGFVIVIVLTIVVGVIGINGMRTIGTMFEDLTEPVYHLAKVSETIQRTRVSVREMVLGVVAEERREIERADSEIKGYVADLKVHLDTFNDLVDEQNILQFFNSGRRAYENELIPVIEGIVAASLAHDMDTITRLLEECRTLNIKIIADFDKAMEMQIAAIDKLNHNAEAYAKKIYNYIFAALIVTLLITVLIVFYLTILISKPLGALSAFMQKASSTGDMSINDEEEEILKNLAQAKDEIGQTVSSCYAFFQNMIGVSRALEHFAQGDLSREIKTISDKDTIGNAMTNLSNNLNKMFVEINASTDHVSSGSQQVADGSQILAEGATEQAASIEKLSSAVSEIAEKTKSNAQRAEEAAELAETIKSKAEKGSHQMDEMMAAVNEINEASSSIGKVIKVIDDIAFQTNILALNAAVEAARAGTAGKGFAVVAEEVRNLAAKSAEAAKDTSQLIENSIEKANVGVRIADDTAESLKEIVSGINESSQIVEEIARSSEEQSYGIEEVNTSIDQIALVVQQNSATAEESAAASQQMSSQSVILQDLIAQFKIKDAHSMR